MGSSTNEDLPRQSSVSRLLEDEVWEEMVAGTQDMVGTTLDDFLTNNMTVKSDAVRRKRRAVVEEPILDKATLHKQRRIIKNRESAARSRERKQAYTVELESLVTHLEEENARLLREEADRKRQRFNRLMECLIPVEDKRQPRRMLRRVNSAQW